MDSNYTLSLENTSAITDAVARHITQRITSFDSRLQQAYVRFAAHKALAGDDIEPLFASVMGEIKTILSRKVGEDLVAAVRISQDALMAPDGVRRWLNDAHKAALGAFHSTAADFREEKASSFDLFLAQVALAGIAEARGLLGVPCAAHERRQARNAWTFGPQDYSDPDVRSAIVKAVFDGDYGSISFLRTRTGSSADDADGQVTLVIATLDGSDEEMRDALAALAGRIRVRDMTGRQRRNPDFGRRMAEMLMTSFDEQARAQGVEV